MTELKIIFILALTLLIGSCSLIGGGNRPVPVKNLSIADGEFLIYDGYSGGEKSWVNYTVSRLDGSNNIVMYIGFDEIKSKYKAPDHYTNYEERIDVSLKGATLIRSRDYWLDYMKMLNRKGQAGTEIEINTNDSEAYSRIYNWDGINITTSTSKTRIKPGYSYWDIDSLGMIGMRFLDLAKPGIVYVIAPEFAKEPVPASFKYYGDEAVDVPAGKFLAGKYGFTISDPFLGKLLGKYASDYIVWVEKGTRGLTVMAKGPWGESRLEKISTWK